MCVSTQPARLSDTTVYIGRTEHPEHGHIEVLGYQNTAASDAGGPNAMLLHLPARGPVTSRNFIPVGRGADPLADMAAALPAPPVRARHIDWMSADEPVEVFEHDVYTVVLAGDPALIPAALARVPVERRPAIGADLLAFYADTFPGYTMALCCFDNADARRARPLMLWYEPADPDVLRMPGLDCHTGGVPVPGAPVGRDHLLLVGGDDAPEESTVAVKYGRGMRHKLRAFLPKRVHGVRVVGEGANGDFVLAAADVRAGRFRVGVV